MQTVIRSKDFALTTSLNRFIKRQSAKSMRACADQIVRLDVRLKNVHGLKGGPDNPDKECSVEVTLPHHAPIVVSKRSSNAYASIRHALGRASRTTLRKLSKRRAIRPTMLSVSSADGPMAHELSNELQSENSDT